MIENQEKKWMKVRNNFINVQYNEATSHYKVNFGTWTNLKESDTLSLAQYKDGRFFIGIDKSGDGVYLNNFKKSYFCHNKTLVTEILKHLEIPTNGEFINIMVPVNYQKFTGLFDNDLLSSSEFTFVIEKAKYIESTKPKCVLKKIEGMKIIRLK